MERVVSVNLGGRAYQLEERAHEALAAYLDRAGAALADNPDKSEILGDLEQAIADKCAAYLNAHKQVVTGPEMARILEEMGPVGGAPGADEAGEAPSGARASASSQEAPRKRLYRIKEGAVISGVSTGLAAYFDLDVALIRALWVVAAIFTNLLAVLVYIVMMFVVPSANTSEEWAAARGVPFNAQGVIDDAKKRYADFEAKGGWRRWGSSADPLRLHRRRARYRAERAAFREERRAWREGRASAMAEPISPPVGYFTQVFAGLVAVIFSIVSAAFTIAFLLAVFSLATTGAVFGHMPPVSLPIWLALILLIVVYAAIATPIGAIRRASFRALSGRSMRGRDDGMDGVLTLVLIGLFLWLAWRFVPGADAVFDSIVAWFNLIWRELQL
jgi:phage shock protein PspC (stress-responsive transcriptional regulator)